MGKDNEIKPKKERIGLVADTENNLPIEERLDFYRNSLRHFKKELEAVDPKDTFKKKTAEQMIAKIEDDFRNDIVEIQNMSSTWDLEQKGNKIKVDIGSIKKFDTLLESGKLWVDFLWNAGNADAIMKDSGFSADERADVNSFWDKLTDLLVFFDAEEMKDMTEKLKQLRAQVVKQILLPKLDEAKAKDFHGDSFAKFREKHKDNGAALKRLQDLSSNTTIESITDNDLKYITDYLDIVAER